MQNDLHVSSVVQSYICIKSVSGLMDFDHDFDKTAAAYTAEIFLMLF